MEEFKGLLVGMVIVAILYGLHYVLPKWFGFVPALLFLAFMLYLIVVKKTAFGQSILILIVGESVLEGIRSGARTSKKNKIKKNIEKMKARDLSQK